MATMNQDMSYNKDWTDMDTAMLVHLAQYAHLPQHRYHTCGWLMGQLVCSEQVAGHDFAEHLRTRHGVTGSDKTLMRCYWVNCSTEMKKESLTRHVQEKHLEWRYPCPNCPEQFTRHYTLNNHLMRKHSGN